MKWTITEPVKALLVDGFPQAVALLPGDTITVLYKAADQDGWDGEIICEMPDGRHIAVPANVFGEETRNISPNAAKKIDPL